MFRYLPAIFASLVIASAARADAVVWSAAATACVPTGATVGHYASAAAISSVKHVGNETGTLVFTCTIQRFTTANTAWVMRLNYRDSTGKGNTAAVVARFYNMPVNGFTPALIATLNSNSSNMTNNASLTSTNSFSHTFDFDANLYFMQVTMTRGASSETVLFHSVALEEK